jgi:hypothetical protein
MARRAVPTPAQGSFLLGRSTGGRRGSEPSQCGRAGPGPPGSGRWFSTANCYEHGCHRLVRRGPLTCRGSDRIASCARRTVAYRVTVALESRVLVMMLHTTRREQGSSWSRPAAVIVGGGASRTPSACRTRPDDFSVITELVSDMRTDHCWVMKLDTTKRLPRRQAKNARERGCSVRRVARRTVVEELSEPRRMTYAIEVRDRRRLSWGDTPDLGDFVGADLAGGLGA